MFFFNSADHSGDLSLFEQSVAYAELAALRLIPQTERFTELYFNDPQSLPKTVPIGYTGHFAFTIHNMEDTSKTYVYLVYTILSNGTKFVIDRKSISLADKESKTLVESYRFVTARNTFAVYVELPENGQNIHFVLTAR
jgi:hypothetical protein